MTKPPRSATVTVYRLTHGQRFAYTATARWEEYCPAAGADHMWRKMPHVMLAKCAEAQALRKAFPKQLAGLFAREEMDQADDPRGEKPPATPALKRIPASYTEIPPPPAKPEAVVTGAPPAEGLPPGFLYVEDVEGVQTENASVTVYTLILSDGREVITKNAWWATLARQYRDQRTPCRVVTHKSRSGEVEHLDDILTGDQTKTPAQGSTPVPPPADDRIPF